jgi:hypothetical protein
MLYLNEEIVMAHWLVNTAGVGAFIAIFVAVVVLAAYVSMLRWIQLAPPDPVKDEGDEAEDARQ